jgi:hypothetical protein
MTRAWHVIQRVAWACSTLADNLALSMQEAAKVASLQVENRPTRSGQVAMPELPSLNQTYVLDVDAAV